MSVTGILQGFFTGERDWEFAGSITGERDWEFAGFFYG